jgi:hypothetical protein
MPIDPGSSVRRINVHWTKDTDTRGVPLGSDALDAEIMLDSFERELHFPARAIRPANRQRRQRYAVEETKQRIYLPNP